LQIMDGLPSRRRQTANELLSQNQYPHRIKPVDNPRLDLLKKDEVRIKRPSMWNIVFYNDDYTPMDFVEFVLKTVFRISMLDALALTLAVHTQGKGIAGTYTFEIAEQKQYEVLLLARIEEHPLRVEVESALARPEILDRKLDLLESRDNLSNPATRVVPYQKARQTGCVCPKCGRGSPHELCNHQRTVHLES
jgi:ATP-dependent Clp protease adaptor protein ClpS